MKPDQSMTLDEIDRRILALLQQDTTLPLEEIGTRVHLSRNAVWRRIRLMEEAGIIRARVALLDPEALGLGLTVFLMVRTSDHRPGWLAPWPAASQSTEAEELAKLNTYLSGEAK